MKKKFIVKKQQEFDYIIKNCKYKKNRYFVAYYKNNDLNYDRYGISVGKKIGNAVKRNKHKRQLRMLIDEYRKLFQKSTDYIIILRVAAKDKSFFELRDEFIKLMENIRKDLINEETK